MEKGPAYVLGIKKIPFPYQITLILFGLLLYFLGIILAYLSGIFTSFMNFWPNVVFILGIIWVSGAFCWAFENYEKTLRGLEDQFNIDSAEYTQIIDNHLKTVYDDKKWVIPSGFFILIFIGFLYAIRSNFMMVYPNFAELLSYPVLWIYFILIVVLTNFVCISGAFLLLEMTSFAQNLENYPLNLKILEVSRSSKLNELTKFSAIASITWFVGLGIFTTIVVTSSDFYTVLMFIFLFFVGIWTFLKPQYHLHRSIKRAKLEKLEEIQMLFEKEYEIFEKDDKQNVKILTLSVLFSEIEKIKEWPVGIQEFITVSGSALFSIITLILRA